MKQDGKILSLRVCAGVAGLEQASRSVALEDRQICELHPAEHAGMRWCSLGAEKKR